MQLFCRHDWEKQSDTVIRAMPEELLSKLSKINGSSSMLLAVKHVVILTCKKCGKVYKSVEKLGGWD